jgi:peroxiredoxin
MMGVRPASLMPGQFSPATQVNVGPDVVKIGMAESQQLQMVLFERGHWCSACRRHLALIADQADEFGQRGVALLAVTHEGASDLMGRVYPFPTIPDPDLAIAMRYDLVGDDEFGKRTIRPATLVVDVAGIIKFSYVGDDSRDRPTVPALLLALDTLAGADVGVGVRIPEANHHAQDGHPNDY